MSLVLLAALLFGVTDAPSCPPGMLLVPGGTYAQGDPEGFPDERPVTQVTVKSFCLDATEVTVAAWAACAHDGRCSPAHARPEWSTLKSREMKSWSELCNTERADRLTHPVNCVVWEEGAGYCAALGLRLPTETEWEYAARGGDEERKFPWGPAAPTGELANLCGTECSRGIGAIRDAWSPLYPQDDGWVGTAPVGSFPAGDARWGHHDLTGNVCEWVSGAYCPYDHPGCGAQTPMCRGNHFLANSAKKARPARRNGDDRWHRGPDVGFRCASDLGNVARARAPSSPGPHLELPSFPRVALAALLALLAGVAIAAKRSAASALVIATLVFVTHLEPQVAISTAFLIVSVAWAATLAIPRLRREVGRPVMPMALAAFAGALGGAALGGFLPARVQLAVLSVAIIAIAAHLALNTPGGGTSGSAPLLGSGLGALAGLLGLAPSPLFEWAAVPVSLAASLGGAVGAGLHSLPDPGLALVMGFAVSLGVVLRGLAPPRPPRRAVAWAIATALLTLGLAIFAREVLPPAWFPWL